MTRLHDEALAIFDARRRQLPPLAFSHPLFVRVFRQWRAWPQQPPGRVNGVSAQNPVLLRCFAALDAAEAEAYS